MRPSAWVLGRMRQGTPGVLAKRPRCRFSHHGSGGVAWQLAVLVDLQGGQDGPGLDDAHVSHPLSLAWICEGPAEYSAAFHQSTAKLIGGGLTIRLPCVAHQIGGGKGRC